jgi:hypothetical protein
VTDNSELRVNKEEEKPMDYLDDGRHKKKEM